jgi:hypothetical protein
MKRAFFLLLIATGVSAQPAPTSTIARWLKAWQDKGLSVRQAFDGSKNESKPASFSYLKPLYTADIGVKFLEWDPLKNSTTATLPIGPSIEWHRTNTPKKSNTLSAKLNMDLAVGQLRGFLPDGTPAPNPAGIPQHDIGFLISIKPGYTHDILTHDDGGEHLLSLTLVSNKNHYPNALNVDTQGRHLWRYAPSVGAEYFGNKDLFDRTETEQKTTDVAFARARLLLVAWPFNENMEDRNEISADLTYRKHVSGQNPFGDTHYLAVQLAHYLDKKTHDWRQR